MKVAAVVITYNLDSRIFLLQVQAFKKFCKDEYVIEVFDNSFIHEFSEAIKYHCKNLGIEYRKTEASSRNGSDSHAFAANLSYQMLKDKYDYFFYIDHDCIPVIDFSVIELLGLKLMAGVGQSTTHKYMWPGCMLMNTNGIDKSLIDFSPSHEFGLDTGGCIYKVIEKYGEENFIFFNEEYCEIIGFKGKEGYYSMINDGMFFHCIAASNWEKSSRHEERINTLLNMVKAKINA